MFIRKKKSNDKITAEPVTIANKVASNEVYQQNNHLGNQGVQHNIYEKPKIKESLTIENEQFEMQKIQQ